MRSPIFRRNFTAWDLALLSFMLLAGEHRYWWAVLVALVVWIAVGMKWDPQP